MKRILLAGLGCLALSGCGKTETAEKADEFLAHIDSLKFDKAWEMLTDDDKAAAGVAEFARLFTDSTRTSAFDTLVSTEDIRVSGDTTFVRQVRQVPDWNMVSELLGKKRKVKDLLEGLAEKGNLRMVTDTERVVAVISKGGKFQVRLNLAPEVRYRKAIDSLEKVLASQVSGSVRGAVAEGNITTFCNATGSVKSTSEFELKDIVFDVTYGGKPFGTYTYEKTLSPKGKWSGDMGIYYADGMGPETFCKGRGVASLAGGQFRMTAVKATPTDRKDLLLKARQITGATPLHLL